MAAGARAAAPTMDTPAVKREVRKRIMKGEDYKRGAAPFEKDIHNDVTEKMSVKFKSELVEEMKESSFREITSGEGKCSVTFELAQRLESYHVPPW